MKVIGLTGGIGSGKSTVSQFLAELGAVIIDADKIGHEAFKPGAGLWREVVAAFGRQILAPDGDIDRKKLGRIVFANAEALARLNQMVHPRIYEMVKAEIEQYRRRGVEVAILEAPLLIDVPLSMKAGEPSLLDEVDEVWVTVAAESMVLRRLKEKLGLSEQESLARIRSQLSPEARLKHADVVINNDGDLSQLKQKVRDLWQKLSLDI
ncbi:MAG: dephospho-CoA kinase [Dehalococcoidia bacterium]|nr:dephospho-CoA kinase [Dehalococcoidia bacterium]